MMDEGSASSEPDVGTIDLSSHSSGRRRRGVARHHEHYNIMCGSICAHTHTYTHVHMYSIFTISTSNGQRFARASGGVGLG